MCQIVVAANPKEYFEQFGNLASNKKHKGIRKNTSDMKLENYADRIFSFNNHENLDSFRSLQQKFQVVNRNLPK